MAKSSKELKSELKAELGKLGLTLHTLQVKTYIRRPLYVIFVSDNGKYEDSGGLQKNRWQ